jgi:hypothetical protein
MPMRLHHLAISFGLSLLAGSAQAVQVCKYDSIPATASASRFIDNGNGTMTDKATRLQWKRCVEGQTWTGGTCTGSATAHNWRQALQLADAASYAGRDDWRVPNIKELNSIVEHACVSPAIDLTVFPGDTGWDVWSASPHGGFPHRGFPNGAWYVYFYSDSAEPDSRFSGHHVRLVRGGQ